MIELDTRQVRPPSTLCSPTGVDSGNVHSLDAERARRVGVELVDRAELEEEQRLAALAADLRSLARDASVDLAIRIGRLVIDRLYAGDLSTWRSRGAKAHSLRALARRADLPISTSALYRSIALFELASRMGGVDEWSELGVSHLRLVLGLPSDEQRRLLDQACAGNWTVAELERETTVARGRCAEQGQSSKRGGRPRLPRFVKSLNRLRKYAEASEELFGDLDAAATMSAQELAELRATLELVRSRCDQLQQALADT
jgi:hypothetical protein